MAELILRSKIKERKIKWWDVHSCGINAAVGSSISKNSKIVLSEIGINCQDFTPVQLTQKKIEGSNIVITMTELQKQLLEDCGNVVCISDICGYEIPDPYGGDIQLYRTTRKAIESACDKIIEKYILNTTLNTGDNL
jgi:protein-tyrosine-phosphatase